MKIYIKTLNNNPQLLKQVRKFLFKNIKNEFGYNYVSKWHQDIINLEEYYIKPNKNNFFLALNSQTNEIIATIGIRAYDKDFEEFKNIYTKDKTASIWRLFVDERYRRCGLASRMFHIAENFAKEVNFENIYLHTHKNLNGALDFWIKMGFIITVESNNKLQTIHMDKNIRKIELISNTPSYAIDL